MEGTPDPPDSRASRTEAEGHSVPQSIGEVITNTRAASAAGRHSLSSGLAKEKTQTLEF